MIARLNPFHFILILPVHSARFGAGSGRSNSLELFFSVVGSSKKVAVPQAEVDLQGFLALKVAKDTESNVDCEAIFAALGSVPHVDGLGLLSFVCL